MEFNKKDIEYYLLNKEYDALSTEELKIVGEGIPSKEEYSSMRQLLLVMEEAPLENELTPNAEIKDSLVAAFEKSRWEQGIGTKNETKIVPIHKEKENKRRGVFWFSIAASIVLLVGLFLNREFLFMPENNQLAMLEDDKSVEKELEKKEKELVIEDNELDFEDSVVLKEANVELNESEEEVSADYKKVAEASKEPLGLNKEKVSVEATPTNQPQSSRVIEQEGNGFAKNEVAEKNDLDADTFEDSEMLAIADEVSMELDDVNIDKDSNSSKFKASKDGKNVESYESVSLKEDKEMIDLFYTAL